MTATLPEVSDASDFNTQPELDGHNGSTHDSDVSGKRRKPRHRVVERQAREAASQGPTGEASGDTTESAGPRGESTALADLGVSGHIVANLAKNDITDSFAIQTQALPPALAGRDVAGKAPTGSGKTLAFAIPVVQRTGRARPKRPRALILTPTRELAAQIADELRMVIGRGKTSVATFYGGVGFGPQIRSLRRGVDIAVACPGRLADLIRRGECNLDDVEIAVLDEADRMADMGFLPEVRALLDQVRPDRQTLLFSATLDGAIDVLVRNYQRDPVRCEVAPRPSEPDRTVHTWLPVDRADRLEIAAQLVDTHGSTVLFCRTKRGADRVARQLTQAGISAVAIHGGRTQAQRDRALATFTKGRAAVLVATDVAARGIHVDDVACVVHFDVAGDHKDYVHRSGRTGRAGAEGQVFTLVTKEEAGKARSIQRALGGETDGSDEPRGRSGRQGRGRSTGRGGRSRSSSRGSRGTNDRSESGERRETGQRRGADEHPGTDGRKGTDGRPSTDGPRGTDRRRSTDEPRSRKSRDGRRNSAGRDERRGRKGGPRSDRDQRRSGGRGTRSRHATKRGKSSSAR